MARALTPEQKQAERRQQAGAFLDDVAKFVPAEKAAGFTDLRTVLESNDAAVSYIHDTYLRKQEGSRMTNQLLERERVLSAQEQLNRDWWEKHEKLARIGDAAITTGLYDPAADRFLRTTMHGDPADDGTLPADGRPPTPPQRPNMPVQPTNAVTQEDIQRIASSFETQTIKFTADVNMLQARHNREFNEVLDVPELIQYAQAEQIPLPLAYDRFVGERRETARLAKQTADLEAAKKEAFEEGRRSAMTTPYPSPTQANTVLSNINKPLDENQFGVAAAAAELDKLVRAGSDAGRL